MTMLIHLELTQNEINTIATNLYNSILYQRAICDKNKDHPRGRLYSLWHLGNRISMMNKQAHQILGIVIEEVKIQFDFNTNDLHQ